MLKFKKRTAFQFYIENLELYDHNTKQPLLIKVSSTTHCKKPSLNDDSSFYFIYSPYTFKLRTKESILLNLQFKPEIPKHIDWSIGVLPSYTGRLTIEISEEASWIKDDYIVLDILNRDFNNTFTIKKYQELGYIFLNNQKSFEKELIWIN